jgi:hypothetical protein
MRFDTARPHQIGNRLFNMRRPAPGLPAVILLTADPVPDQDP